MNDLYGSFGRTRDRWRAGTGAAETIAPVVKWGQPALGPYTWTIDATSQHGVRCGVVSLPPSFARHGLAGWAALAHETAGHDIVHADHALASELSRRVEDAIAALDLGFGLGPYWSRRIDETASDVMGVLNMGPAAAIGLIAYLRAIRSARGGVAKLTAIGPANDRHPADLLRGFLVAATVRRLPLSDSDAWSGLVSVEVERDIGPILLSGIGVPTRLAIESAEIVVEVIMASKLDALAGGSLVDLRCWRDDDADRVAELALQFVSDYDDPGATNGAIRPSHAVAAAVLASIRDRADARRLFTRLLDRLGRGSS